MRISLKQLLQGLLYLTPITLLVLASCGGGGGGGGSASLASYYPLSVNVTGLTGAGLVLRNGGDDQPVTASGTVTFATAVLSSSTYNISVKSQPATQVCTVTSPVGTMPASAKTVYASCATSITITGGVSGGSGNVVLQNNGGDNQTVDSNGGTLSFPIVTNGNFNITVLSNPVGYTCVPSNNIGTNVATDPGNVTITCNAITGATPPDSHLFVANQGTNNVSAYAVNTSTGAPLISKTSSAGSKPSAIAAYGGKYVFVTNSSANTVSAYAVSSGVIATTPTNTLTENSPTAIAVHPSGKFVYVVNKLSNSISAYSVNTTTGALASIDTDTAAGTQSSIKTALTPVAIAINPTGTYAYVASLGSSAIGVCSHISSSTNGCISLYAIDANGALTAEPISGTSDNIDTGVTPSAIANDGTNVYVTNLGNDTVSVYAIGPNGTLGTVNSNSIPSGTNPSSIAIDQHYNIAYIAGAGNDTVLRYVITTTTLGSEISKSTGSVPASIAVDSTGQYVYVANSVSNNISAYSTTNGTALTELSSGSPAGAGTTPVSVTTSP